MVTLKEVLAKTLSEREAIIYLLIENTDQTISSLGKALGMSRENVRLIYEKAKEKLDG